MATTTTRLALYKPIADGSETANVVTDLNNNFDKIDAALGALPCTSGTRPVAPFNGQFIRETDTGKLLLCTNTVGPVWDQVLFNTAQFGQDIVIPAGKVFAAGADLGNAGFSAQAAAAADDVFRHNVVGDPDYRTVIDATATGGRILFGSGAIAPDTTFYRSGVGQLKTDGGLWVVGAGQVDGNLAVGGSATITGNLNLGSARYRNQLGATATVGNTTTSTDFATMVIPANDMVVGATYRIVAYVFGAVTGTPTLTFRANITGGGTLASASAITASSGVTNRNARVEAMFTCVATGVGGSCRGFINVMENFSTSGSQPGGSPRTDGTSASPIDTTAALTFSLRAQWSAASPSNTITCYSVAAERVA